MGSIIRTGRCAAVVLAVVCTPISTAFAAPEKTQTPKEAAHDWVKQQIGRDPKTFDSILNAPTDWLAGRQVGATMHRILKRVHQALDGKTRGRQAKAGGPCKSAARSQAWTASLEATQSRLFRGAAATGIDLTTAVPGAARKLAEYARGEGYKKIEQWAWNEIRKQDPVDFVMSSSSGGCTRYMAVVWVKKTDTYRFTIVGDCGCNKVHCWPGQSSRTVRLAKWSVTGEGKITPKISIVKGKPVVSFTIGAPRIVVNANCCGTPDAENKGYWMEPPKRDTSTSVPTTPQRPVTPRNPGSSSTAKTPKPSQPTPKQPESPRNPRMIPVDIPKLPTGSVCRHDLDALYESLVKARETANANAIKAAKAKTLLQLALDAGESGVTQAMIDAAEQLKKTWFRKEAAIRKLLQEAGSLKIEENCKKQNPGHSSVPQTPQEETSSAAVPVDDDETEEEESTHTISETPHTVVAIPLPIARPVIAISEHNERGARRRIETTARHVVARGERLRRNHRLHRGEGFHRYSVERRLHRLARGFLHRSFRGRGWMGGRMRHGFRGMRHREFGMRSRGFRMRGMGMRSVGMRGMRLR